MFFCCEYVFLQIFRKKVGHFLKNGHREVKDRVKTRCGFFCSSIVTLSVDFLASCSRCQTVHLIDQLTADSDSAKNFSPKSCTETYFWPTRSGVGQKHLAKTDFDNVTTKLQKKTTASFHAIFHLPVSVFKKIDQIFFRKICKKNIFAKKTYFNMFFLCLIVPCTHNQARLSFSIF